MEKKIIFPKSESNEILVTQVEDQLENKGIINVFDVDNDLVGHVVLDNSVWIFRSINSQMESSTLAEIMVEYNTYSFKLIT